MERHFEYWGDQLSRGAAVLFGPVADPKGAYGIAVLDVENEEKARNVCANDPVLITKLGFTFGLYEMPNAVVRKGA